VSWGALQYAVLVVSENESVDQLCNAATAAARNVFFERLAKFRRTSPSMKQDMLANASLQSIVSMAASLPPRGAHQTGEGGAIPLYCPGGIRAYIAHFQNYGDPEPHGQSCNARRFSPELFHIRFALFGRLSYPARSGKNLV